MTREDIAFLQYTGGTTGVAKGAMLTHRNILANVEQTGVWISASFKEGAEIAIAPLPMYHIFCLTSTLAFMKWGSLTVLITNPRDMPAFIKELKRWKFSVMTGVNTLFNALMNTPGFSEVDFSHLVATVGGGMAVQRAVAERWKQLTGCEITQGWGLTEASPAGCVNPLVGVSFTGAIGLPLPSTEVSIRDDAGAALGINEVGEICMRGPQVMSGYWQRPDETAKVMLPDGWLRTGDIGRMDERGYVFIEDRKKDIIIVSGFKVFPNEVEDVVATHPGVAEVAAVAQPDERAGETVALFVVRKDPSLTAEQLMDYCHKFLTGYKVPRHIYFRDELPKTNVGKIMRKELRSELAGPGASA